MRDIGPRLRAKREALEMSLCEAAKAAGFTNLQVLSKIERGIREVKANELACLARVYNFDLNVFLLNKEILSDTKIFWRAITKPTRVQELEARFKLWFERYIHLQNLLVLEGEPTGLKLQLITRRLSSVVEAVDCGEEYCHSLRLGDRPALTFRQILEEEWNLPVFFCAMPVNTSAVSMVIGDYASICVSKKDAAWRRNFDIAHELFHILYRKDEPEKCGMSNDDVQEAYANAFASALLLPRRVLENDLRKLVARAKLTITDLIVMACEYDVSVDAFLWRLVNLGRMKKTMADTILKDRGVRDYYKSLRKTGKDRAPYISEKYVCMVFNAVSRGLVSEARAAEYLSVSVGDIDRVFGEAGLVRTGDVDIEITV